MILVAVVAATAYSAARGGTLAEVTQPASAAICDNVTQHSGYFKLTTGRKHYFYWFFESRSAPKTDPLVLWMTGGPGCSSEVALFGENGPCSVNAAGTGTIRNKYSWNTRANLVYIDQPAGTGFSYGSGLDHDEAGVARDMYDFLQQLLQAHPALQPLDFYVVGESYAGHYVPAVTHEVWANNKALPSGAIRINLKGTSVGNGLVAPEIQYQYYKDMVVSTNGHKPAVGNLTHAAMQAATPACIAAIKACQAVAASCLVAIEVCNAALLLPYQASGMNVYDMREPCEKPPLCYDFSNVATYLDRAEVRAALGVGQRKWSDCNHVVALGFELSGDWMQSYEKKLPDQLGDGVRVLIYAGDQDYICNWLGNQAWAQAMPWPHRADFAATSPVPWMAGGKQAGTLQSSHGFSFLRVYDAGHMVPRDQPANALAMLHAFLDGEM